MLDFRRNLGDHLERQALRQEIARRHYERQQFALSFDEVDDKNVDKFEAFEAADSAMEVLDQYLHTMPDDTKE